MASVCSSRARECPVRIHHLSQPNALYKQMPVDMVQLIQQIEFSRWYIDASCSVGQFHLLKAFVLSKPSLQSSVAHKVIQTAVSVMYLHFGVRENIQMCMHIVILLCWFDASAPFHHRLQTTLHIHIYITTLTKPTERRTV